MSTRQNHVVSLRGEPLERDATLPDGRAVLVRVGVPDDSYLGRPEVDTVLLELVDVGKGEHLAAVATMLGPDDDSAARELLHEAVEGLASGALAPTAGALEPLADTVRR
ncbi:MAG TPA: hypothetical protein VE088_04055 [Gaiellaceae bacterium]|nr:hypothetical protein [Gaiellaceae bacterium]